jgi:hypothetical protein
VTLLHKISSIPSVYWLWGSFFLLLIAQFLWAQFMAYPSAFERQLRGGKPWVYIPMRWKGFHKSLVSLLSRILILALAINGTALFVHYTHRRHLWSVILVILILGILAARLGGLWTHLRYRQQEDVYYRLHDELRAKLELEGKDFTEAQLRHLAIYQHQQHLRKAEEGRQFLTALRQEARRARGNSVSSPLIEA